MKTVTVQSLPDYNYAVLVNDGRHAWVSDEAKDDEGDDLGPNPQELLLSALGSCTAITLFMYARRKQWALEEIAVHLTHDRVPAADSADCTEEERAAAGPSGRIEIIRVDISVRGELDGEQTARLLEIAARCPVHRTLTTPPKIVSRIIAGT